MRQIYPVISCICVAGQNTQLLKRTISNFENQNYPKKELTISYDIQDEETRSTIDAALKNTDLKILKISRENGETTTVSINNAIIRSSGDYICLWDSNNWYHPSRLSFQYLSIQDAGYNYKASILKRIIIVDSARQKAYSSSPYIWMDSILCSREVLLKNPFTDFNNGELKDESLISFLQSKKSLYFIENSAFLYVHLYDDLKNSGLWNYEYLMQKELLDEEIPGYVANSLFNH